MKNLMVGCLIACGVFATIAGGLILSRTQPNPVQDESVPAVVAPRRDISAEYRARLDALSQHDRVLHDQIATLILQL
jgi:hypothetical protein